MTKQKRIIVVTNLKELATGLLARSKNGPRALLRRCVDKGHAIEVTFSDIPAYSANYEKVLKHEPSCFWGIYDNKATVEQLISDMSVKE